MIEGLAALLGMSSVSLLHSLLPTHWLPFSVVGRAHGWSLSKTLLITAVGGCCHVMSTTLLGLTAATVFSSVFSEESVHALASIVLIVMGTLYMLMFYLKMGHHHHHHHSHLGDRMVVVGLILVPTLSPCASTLPVFLTAAGSHDRWEFVTLCAGLLASTLTVMLSMVTISYMGAATLKSHAFDGPVKAIEKYDKLVVGAILCGVGVITYFSHNHDHDHGAHGHDYHGHHDEDYIATRRLLG